MTEAGANPSIVRVEFNCKIHLQTVKEKLNEDADCEIATTMLRVSLICPLGKMRMSTPCR